MPRLENIEPDIEARIGELIRLRRIEIGLSQAELAAMIGMSFQQVQKYERGTNRLASSILIRVAEALNCSAAELLGEQTLKDNAKWLKALVADRELSALMERLVTLKSAVWRRRIVHVLTTMVDDATDQRPQKVAAASRASKTVVPVKNSKSPPKKTVTGKALKKPATLKGPEKPKTKAQSATSQPKTLNKKRH